MKQDMTYQALVKQVASDAAARRDFLVPTKSLRVVSNERGSVLNTQDGSSYAVRESAHVHIARLAGMYLPHYTSLREQNPGLLDSVVNHWFEHNDSSRLVRTLDKEVRAVASERYGALDNDALLKCLEPVIASWQGNVEACHMSERWTEIKLVSPCLLGEVKPGDAVQVGLAIRNSETCFAGLSARLFVVRLVCKNGMVMNSSLGSVLRRRHYGPSWEGDERSAPANCEIPTWQEMVWEEFSGMLEGMLNQGNFRRLLGKLQKSAAVAVAGTPISIAERVAARFHLPLYIESAIAHHLTTGGHGTGWDVANGVTRAAQDVSSFELATSLETLGGRLVEFDAKMWKELINPN